jgi:hypothetical protein
MSIQAHGGVFSRNACQERWRADAADPIREGPVAKHATGQVFRLQALHPAFPRPDLGLQWLVVDVRGHCPFTCYGGASAVVFHHTSHGTDSSCKDTTQTAPLSGLMRALFGMLCHCRPVIACRSFKGRLSSSTSPSLSTWQICGQSGRQLILEPVFMFTRTRLGAALLLLGMALCLPQPAIAAADTAPSDLLEDFVHYALTAQVPMAQANGDALLNSGLSDEALAELVDENPRMRDRLPVALRWAREVPELEGIAAKIEHHVERGRLDRAQNNARIQEAIKMLGGTRRARTLAHGRLVEAGEYAVPPLLRALNDPSTPAEISLGVTNTLPSLGREAVLPLTTALPHVADRHQVVIINALADIGYPHAAAALVRVSRDEESSDVVGSAARRAIQRLGWDDPESISLAGLHVQMAEDYLREMEHLRARPTLIDGENGEPENMQNVWTWDHHGGLLSQHVPTDLYWPVMAIREANEARVLNPQDSKALATFVAGNLRLENRIGDRDVVLPVPDLERSPSFHATVNGPAVARDVLLMAIDQNDAAMARDALHALSLTAGASSLIGGSSREAITEALAYPDQRVRYDAALVVARAMPAKAFPGSSRVIPLLGSAVYGGAGRQAIVIGGTSQSRLAAASRLESLGYDVSAEGENWDAVVASRAADAMDLAYVMGDTNSGLTIVESLVKTDTPVVLVVPDSDFTHARTMTAGLRGVGVLRASASDNAFAHSVASLGIAAPMDDSDRRFYTAEAVAALRELAIARPAGLNVNEAKIQLERTVESTSGPAQLQVAEVLALINDGAFIAPSCRPTQVHHRCAR